MAFTLYGPGVRDEIALDNLFKDRVVTPPNATPPSTPKADENKEDTLRGRLAQRAYQSTGKLKQDREPAINAHQIMSTKVVTLTLDSSIYEAWNLFREKRFRHVPVLSREHKLIGMLSDRALLRYAATTGQVPPYAPDSPQAKTSIRAITSLGVITATPDTRIREIARMMFEKRVGAMPIVDQYGNIVGIITRSDILRTLVNHAPLELWI